MKIKDTIVNIVKDDITELKVEAIVNAASSDLTMEEGLAGVIKKKGGIEIEEEATSYASLAEGKAVSTNAGSLFANHIIHAVTVVGNLKCNQDGLRKATRSALECAEKLGVSSLAFPTLGCGVGEFPLTGSGKIMVQEVLKFIKEGNCNIKQVTFCLYEQDAFKVFDTTIRDYIRHMVEDLGPGPYVTVDIIIELPEGVVLIERSNPPFGWALPGGFVDYGESLEEAAIREAKEETNLDLADLRQFHTYSKPTRDPRFHTISTVFIGQGKGEAQFGDDAKGLKIVRYEDLPTLEYAFDHNEIIKEYLMEREMDF